MPKASSFQALHWTQNISEDSGIQLLHQHLKTCELRYFKYFFWMFWLQLRKECGSSVTQLWPFPFRKARSLPKALQPAIASNKRALMSVSNTIFNSESLQQRVIIVITPVCRCKNWVTEGWSDSPKSRTESIAELGIERRTPCLIHWSPQIISFYKCSIFVKTSVL